MAIEKALYYNGEIFEEVSLHEIEQRKDYTEIRNNLLCAFNGCSAKIKYVPKGKRVAHFKTWPKQDHHSDCIDFFERNKVLQGKKSLAQSSVGLNDKHIRKVLNSFIKEVKETVEEKNARLKNQREKYKKRKNKTVDKLQQGNLQENIVATTSNNVDRLEEGKRAPSVKRRFNISNITESDIKTAQAVYGKVIQIIIEEENRAIFTLDNGLMTMNVYFEESFFENSSRNIGSLIKVVKAALEEGNDIHFFCIGNIEMRNGKLCIIINGQNNIRINEVTIEIFVHKYSNPHLF